MEEALFKHGLTTSLLPEKGRSLFASSDFRPGDLIITEQPYVSVPNTTTKCDHCFTVHHLKKCSSCKFVYYCSTTCQKSDWKLHKEECKALSRMDPNRLKLLTPTIRLMLKLYLRRKLQQEKAIPTTATDNYNLVKALVSHMSEIDDKQLVLYAQMANLVKLVLEGIQDDIDLKEIAESFSKFSCNAHTICDSELRPLATGLYPVISIINHSCIPNATLIFEGRLAVVRAVHYISKGTEVMISYVETAGSTVTRQKTLKEQYFFTCACLRCSKLGQADDIQESAVLEGYRCKDNKCDGFLLREPGNKGFICQYCGLFRDSGEIRTTVADIKLITEKASESLSSGNYCDAASLYKQVERLQVKSYHPFSIILMRTREALLKIFMELQEWKEALSYSRLILQVYHRVYQGCHPLLGLQYYTCGKLEWLLQETREAVKSLTKAVDILRITHGTSTPFMKELLAKLEEARAEVSYKLSSSSSMD